QARVMFLVADVGVIRAFVKLVELAFAGEQEEHAVVDGDALEVAVHASLTECEPLDENAAAVVHLPDLADLVGLGEEASVLRQGETRDLAELSRQHPARERRQLPRRVAEGELAFETALSLDRNGIGLDGPEIVRRLLTRRGEEAHRQR